MMGKSVMLVAVSLALVLGGCRPKGEVYDRTLDETRTVLKQTEVPLHYFGPSADTDFSMVEKDPSTIVWHVTSDGAPVLDYTATMEAESEHKTRVVLTMEGAKSSKFGDVGERMKKYPAIRALYFATMNEATDSALEAREFNPINFYPQITAASMSMVAQLKAPDEKRDAAH